ncbi:restriction endonuclease subunit S [Stappia sp. TSB10P1A]|uniref:restriction endonuclease subunit S n=1 Tax=Stappia sp. TSB10P1A TaxID=2003585 RepID=UPI001643CA1F|nr:restriction endonuclease subunit S [Stappia sp. TSB10P1A]
MAELPANWASTKLGAFSDLVNGRAFKPSDWSTVGLPIIRIQNLRNPDAPFNRFAGATEERHRVSDGDLLFGWSGTPGTSFRAHIWSRGEAVLNQHIFKIVFDPKIANAQFLRIAINAYLPNLVKQAKGGAGLKHLTRSAVEGIPIPLPPRSEQDRIVTALANTAGRLAAVDIELKAMIEGLPYVERQVLVRTITGGLLRPDQDRMISTPLREGGTSIIRIQDVGELQIGRQRSPDVHKGPSMRPYLRVANVLDDHIDAADLMTMNFEDAEFERYRLLPGDILINEGQSLELVGRAAMYRGEPGGVAFTNTLIRFRAGPLVDPEYALVVFRAYQHMGRFREIAKITTNLAHLGLRRFAGLDFPLRPLTEQQDIARIARSLITKIRNSAEALALLRTDTRNLIDAFEARALAGRLSRQSELEVAPTIARLQKAIRSKPQAIGSSRPRVGKAGRTKVMPTKTLVEALAQAGQPLDGQSLFSAAGYPDDASVLQIEEFFLELRRALAEGSIRRTVTDGERFSMVEPDR